MSSFDPDKSLANDVARMMRDHGETLEAVVNRMQRDCYNTFLAANPQDFETLMDAKRRANAIGEIVSMLKNIEANVHKNAPRPPL